MKRHCDHTNDILNFVSKPISEGIVPVKAFSFSVTLSVVSNIKVIRFLKLRFNRVFSFEHSPKSVNRPISLGIAPVSSFWNRPSQAVQMYHVSVKRCNRSNKIPCVTYLIWSTVQFRRESSLSLGLSGPLVQSPNTLWNENQVSEVTTSLNSPWVAIRNLLSSVKRPISDGIEPEKLFWSGAKITA